MRILLCLVRGKALAMSNDGTDHVAIPRKSFGRELMQSWRGFEGLAVKMEGLTISRFMMISMVGSLGGAR